MKQSYLDLSTSHVSEATMHGLDTDSITGVTVAEYQYGAFVSVPGKVEDIDSLECPEDLKVVLRYARGEGCDIIRLDADGDIDQALPRFDW